MLLLLSPAKTLDFDSPAPPVAPSSPRHAARALELIEVLRGHDVDSVAGLMDLSENLAELNVGRYRDFSARRLGTRVRGEAGNHLVHTLNGTACAVGRTLVFLWEHYQDGDTFVVPEVLRPFTGFAAVTR